MFIVPMKRVTNVEGRDFGGIDLSKDTLGGKTESMKSTETKLDKIAEYSRKDPNAEFKWLMPHYNASELTRRFQKLDRKKASGIDGKTKDDYAENLKGNIENLIGRMKTMSYRPQPVKEVLIEKEGQKGKFRPLGISVIEDKIVQSQTSKILNVIYEPIFRNCSYGFRPGRSCHTAVKEAREYVFKNNTSVVIDVDLKNFFGTINHKTLVDFLRIKIKDEKFIRYIVRMLKSGVLSDGEFRMTDEGSPQGNIASPVLSNIYAHYVIDVWFEDVVKKHTVGKAEMFRYADDIVICCEKEYDVVRIKKALKNRLEKYGLQLNEEKTKVVKFDKNKHRNGERQEEFDFLGFTFYWGNSRNRHPVPKVKTAKKRFKIKVERVKEWCKKNRCFLTLGELWKTFVSKIRGHIEYYGVSFNIQKVAEFVYISVRTFFKWINRRSQRKSINWDKFNLFMKSNPLPKVRVKHQLF